MKIRGSKARNRKKVSFKRCNLGSGQEIFFNAPDSDYHIAMDSTLETPRPHSATIVNPTAESSPSRLSMTVVVPCFNESESVQRLSSKIQELVAQVGRQQETVDWHFLFVDDGSSDSTFDDLKSAFGNWTNARVVQHPDNRGLIAALQTGFQHCATSWVGVIDSDCTYEPSLLIEMLDKALCGGYDCVTASPYHRLGSVENVPAWRIGLSRVASWLYRWPMRNKLTCYTCCVRVYKTSLVRECQIRTSGFVGVTELLWRLDQAGAKIGEVPARLTPRVTGVSKMRTFRTTINHFRLLGSILREQLSK